MSDMRVKLILDLENKLKRGAGEAKRDLKGVEDAAKSLSKVRIGAGLSRDLKITADQARAAQAAIARARREMEGFGRSSSARRGAAFFVDGDRKRSGGGPAAAQAAASAMLPALVGGATAAHLLGRAMTRSAETGKSLQRSVVEIARATDASADQMERYRALAARTAAIEHQRGRAVVPAGGAVPARTRGKSAPPVLELQPKRPAAAAQSAEGGSTPPFIAGGAKFLAGAGAAYVLARSMQDGAQKSIALERVMYDVQRATDASADSLSQYRALVVSLSKQTGKSAEEIGGMLAAAGFAGRPVRELGAFTEYAAKATTAWGTSAEQTGQALAEIGNIYSANQKRIEEIGDAINTAADQSAARETDLMDVLRRAGAAGRQIGVSAEQVLALGAALKEVGTQPEVAATALNALFTNLSLGEDATKEFGDALKTLKISDKQLKNMVRKDASSAIVNLLEKIEKIPDGLKRMEVLKQLFGREYADNMGALLNNLGGLKRMLDLMGNKKNYLGSVDRDAQKRMQTDFNRIERAQQQMNELMRRLGDPIKTAAGSIAEAANKLLDDIGELQAKKKELEEAAKNLAAGGPQKDGDPKKLGENPAAGEIVGNAIREHEHGRQGAESTETRGRMEDMAPEYATREHLRQKRRNLEGEISALEKYLKLTDPTGTMKSGKRRRLHRLQRELDNLPWDDNVTAPPRGPADRRDRAATGARETADRKDRELQIKRLRELYDVSPHSHRRGLADRIQQLQGGGREDGGFHLGRPNTGGKGVDRRAALDALQVDLRPAGELMARQFADGLRSGQAGAESAASSTADGVKTAMTGVDLSGAGQQMMATFAAGIRAGGAAAIAEAQKVASAVSSAASNARVGGASGGRTRISGALHDGVNGA